MLYLAESICRDYTLATILSIIKRTLTLIQFVVPFILLISGIMKFTKLMLNPDNDKKGLKAFFNSIIAATIIFFLPLIINTSMHIISVDYEVGIIKDDVITAFDISSCWEAVDQIKDEMDSANETTSSTIKDEEQKKLTTLK